MGNRTRSAHCRLTAFGAAVLSFPYNAPLINALKAGVPFKYRTYDGASKSWTIEPPYADLAIEILLEQYPDTAVPRRPGTQATAQAPIVGHDHFAALHLLPTAPLSLIHAAYRCLAKLSHPDVGGGDAATMRRLSEAHDALTRGLSA